ncbi:hypothetical protein [Brevibacillus brevis]|uniref:hypothetical protein n=1 Tax=Brevibacillus brevis TaxID=1393 RepID=UPI0025A5A8B5|nr:hypothetical protein [Brevibacillus brevis]WJQ82600.1 hypothetical protein QN310_05485 [Brevibacillus brevis]
MSMVLTLNKIIDFPDNMDISVIGKETVMIEGKEDTAETRIYKEDDQTKFITGYTKYNVRHSQRYKIEGKLWGREFSQIMRLLKLSVYTNASLEYAYSIGTIKADFAHSAFSRLRKGTSVKCEPIEVDLIETVEKIIKFAPDIAINSGWFSNLGLPNLNNVLLQGDSVNLGPEWNKFKKSAGASLSNIELIIDDKDFDKNYVKVSLSKRGVIFSHTNLTHKKLLEIAEKIQSILNKKLITVP